MGRIVEYFSSMHVLCLLTRSRHRAPHPFITDPTRSCEPMAALLHPALMCTPLQYVVSPRLIVDNERARRIVLEATHAIAGLHSLTMPMPGAAAMGMADWYSVSHKCDGTRYMLMVMEDGGVYFKNRVGFVYEFPLSNPLPPATILDGELVWCAEGGVFLAFDAVVLGGVRVWALPLDQRLAALSAHLLDTDEALTATAYTRGTHRQRARAGGSVQVLRKRHHRSVEDAMKSEPPFPSDGLVFTPRAMPYVLLPLLLRKWQPWRKRAVDLMGRYNLVYECCLNAKGRWTPSAIRWDKTHGSKGESIGGPCADESFFDGPDLVDFLGLTATMLAVSPCCGRTVMSKAQCLEAVEAGRLSKSGQKRATTYVARGGAAAAARPAARKAGRAGPRAPPRAARMNPLLLRRGRGHWRERTARSHRRR